VNSGVGLKQLFLRGKGRSWVLIGVLKASQCMKLRWSMVQEREGYVVGPEIIVVIALGRKK